MGGDVTTETRKPWWLYPNLLSLDAPAVAVAWLFVFARTWRVDYHPGLAYLALGLVVWIIYASDRLLDVTLRDGGGAAIAPRHLFHQRHRKAFQRGIAAIALATIVLVVGWMPYEVYRYLTVGGILVAGYLSLSLFSSTPPGETPYAKNILAGLAFAYGTAMVAHVYLPMHGLQELLRSRELLCFATLCALNIHAIDLWESGSERPGRAHDELVLTILLVMLALVSLSFAVMDAEQTTRPYFYAILTGAALLHILNQRRKAFTTDQLRVLADLALLAPVAVFFALA